MAFDPATAVPVDAPPKTRFDPSTIPPLGQLSNPSAVQPTAEQMLRDKEAVANRNAMRKQEEGFINDNALPDAPLKTREELPAMLRAKLSAEPDPTVQAAMLTKDGMPARVSKDKKNVIVRTWGGDGNPMDVLLHPFGAVTAGTIAGEAVPIAKMAANAGLAFLSSGASLLPAAGLMGVGAAGIEGAATGLSRLASGQPLSDTGKRAVKEGIINAALPLAGAGVSAATSGAGKILRSGMDVLENKLPAAADRLGIPTSVGETTGSPTLSKLARLTPAEDATRQNALRTSLDREVTLGGGSPGPLASEADIARNVQPIFSASEDAAAQVPRRVMSDAEREAQRVLKAQLDAGLVPAGASNSAVGQHIRGKFDEFVQKVKDAAERDYSLFHAKAAGEGITLDPAPITKLVAKIEQEDPHGVAELLAPSVRQVKGVEEKLTKPLAEAQPAKYSGLQQTTPATPEVPAPPLTFDEAIRQRAIVRQKLNAPDDPLGDVVKTYYKQLDKAYTEAIDGGLAKGSDDLRTLYETARSGYKQGATLLEKGVVQKLFREPGEAGRVADENVVRQMFTGTGKLEALRDMKQILGANTPDYKLLLRQGVQNMMDDAAAKGSGGMIDVNTFLSRFNGLDKEMRAEVFGPLEAPLKATAEAMGIAQKGAPAVAKIPAEELTDALAGSPGSVKNLINQAVRRQQAYEQTYNGSIQQQLRNGVLTARTMGSADDFLTRFIGGANTSVADVRQALTQIGASSPAALEDIRKRTLQNVIDATRIQGGAAPLGKATTGQVEDLNYAKLLPYLKGTEREKYQAVLGDRGIKFLDDLATYAEATAKRQGAELGRAVTPETLAKESLSGAAGFRRNAIGALVDIAAPVGRFVGLGALARNPGVRRFLETGVLPQLYQPAEELALAATGTVRGANKVLADTKNETFDEPPPLAQKVRTK